MTDQQRLAMTRAAQRRRLLDEQIRRADFAIRLDVRPMLRDEGSIPAVPQPGERAGRERRLALQAARVQRGRSGRERRC